jgi:hypothetical protein
MNSTQPLEILVTDSYKELTSLLEWFSKFGPIPTIIGGWAVYCYNSYFGSIDIDLVGPSHQGRFIDIIERYERTHGYEFTAKDEFGLEVTSRKPVRQNGSLIGYMEIDACTFDDPSPARFHENPQKQLPYALTAEKQHRREVKLAKDAVCYTPTKPLLLLYKTKAARDRAYDLRTKGTTMASAKAERLRGKLTKDRADLLALLDPQPTKCIIEEEFDNDAFSRLLKRLHLEFILETLASLPKCSDSIRLYNPTLNAEQIQKWTSEVVK